jgi:hypothetical protein
VKLGGVTVERRDTDLWAVVDGSFCLNREGEWEYERHCVSTAGSPARQAIQHVAVMEV